MCGLLHPLIISWLSNITNGTIEKTNVIEEHYSMLGFYLFVCVLLADTLPHEGVLHMMAVTLGLILLRVGKVTV